MPAPPAEPAPALRIAGLSHSYGTAKALDDVRLELPRARFVALLGHNGAGKTTLFSLILRLMAPPVGTIFVEGCDVAREPTAALAPIGVVFQEPTLDLDLSVGQNLAYFGALRGMAGGLVRQRIAEGLARAGLADAFGKRVRALSSGQRRRVEIVRAMLHAPRLLLLDEPTTGLDVPARSAIVAHVHALSREEEGVTVLWATHLIDEVEPGDDIIVLNKGQVAASGSYAEVLAKTGAATMAEAFATLLRPRAAVPAGR